MNKPRRKSRVNFKNMTNKANPGGQTDPKQFDYALNNKGVFECEMRFIEPPQEEIEGKLEGVPFVELLQHKFKDHNGREMAHQCRKMLPLEEGLTSKRDMCPICTYVAPLWDEGREEEYREYKAKSLYVANVLIITNKDNPETEGKIFQLYFTYQIFNILKTAMEPDGGLEDPIDPFSIDNAPNFIFKVKKKGKYNNYESSKFREQGTALTDEQLEFCDANTVSLVKHLDRRLAKVESYDKLCENFYNATGEAPEGWEPSSSRSDDDVVEEEKSNSAPKPKKEQPKKRNLPKEEESSENDGKEESQDGEPSPESEESTSTETETEKPKGDSGDEDDFWEDV